VTAPQVVEPDDEKFSRIEWTAWADQVFPPTFGFQLIAVVARDVMMTGKGVADEYRIRARRIELAVSLDHQFEIVKHRARRKRQSLIEENFGRCNKTHRISREIDIHVTNKKARKRM
jgi:hypothetical protein